MVFDSNEHYNQLYIHDYVLESYENIFITSLPKILSLLHFKPVLSVDVIIQPC